MEFATFAADDPLPSLTAPLRLASSHLKQWLAA
jgi:hypothetical protein